MPWEPTNVIEGSWGRVQVVMDGVDVTFYRGVPAVLEGWTRVEPFGPSTAVIRFPQVTPFEALPGWMDGGSTVELYRVDAGGARSVIWEGFVMSLEEAATREPGIGVHCSGALFQADLYVKAPVLYRYDTVDVGTIVVEELDPGRRPGLRTLPLPLVSTGVQARRSGSWQPLLTGYIQELLSRAQTQGVMWTLHLDPGRKPVMRVKDTTTVHWRVHIMQPGVEATLTKDWSTAPTTIFGEGVDPENCRWRNSKFPFLTEDDAPLFPGTIINVGESGQGMAQFEQQLRDRGWLGFTVDDFYSSSEEFWVREFQRAAGIQVDGDIGPQTWAAAFEVGANQGDVEGAFIAPLYSLREVERWNYDAPGHIVGENVDFDPAVLRVERYENFGPRITKEEGIRSATQEVGRDHPPSWLGRIVLRADPQEGSRLDVREGQNILLRGHRGADRLLHIAEANISISGEEIVNTLTVDEKARDRMTIGEMLKRNRETTDPTRRQVTYKNPSRLAEDRIAVWDCENGSGVIPYHATFEGLWNVLRIPAGELGTIVRTEFEVETEARFSVGIFDRPVTANQIREAGSPMEIEDFWEQGYFSEASGLMVAWGDMDEPAGYSPGLWSRGDLPTRKLVDGSQWYFESQEPPWLWVALWVESPQVNHIWGRLYPSNEWV